MTNSASLHSNELVLDAKAFFAELNSSTVTLIEVVNTEHDPLEDYFVETELIFEPSSLSECWLKLLFTDDGAVGFGIENSGRLRARLRGLSQWSYAPPFIGGREPAFLPKEDVLAVLRAVAAGDLKLVVWTLFGRIVAASLKISVKHYSIYEPIRHDAGRLLAFLGVGRRHELTFAPWSTKAQLRPQ